jgi:serine/threonine protein kinase
VRLGRHVAMKFRPRELAADREALDRFRREARVASALNQPNIYTLYHVGDHDGEQFMLMELLDGRTPKEAIPRGPPPFDHAGSTRAARPTISSSPHSRTPTRRCPSSPPRKANTAA